MRIFWILTVLCAVAIKAVVAEGENDVRRSAFPFMAFLYYTDETIIDNGPRFIRSGALIKNDWLISSGDVSIAFPQKTLLARLGSVAVDNKFTFNEDEDEQEREIILILRPYNYSTTEWWKTDISLLKTLLPFNMTASVAPANLISNFDSVMQNCYILVYANRENAADRTLEQIFVKLLPPVKESCGIYYKNGTMVCAESETNALADTNFCKGNSGGPLVCESELIGTQTYFNDCKQPHLYQFVPGWSKLISCIEDERYLTHACVDVCVTISKDPVVRAAAPDASQVIDILSDVLGDKTQTILNDSTYSQFTNGTTNSSTASKVEETVTTKKEEILSTNLKETQREVITIKPTVTISIENFSHDTTATSTDTTYYAEEDAAMETTSERDRKNRIEAKQQLKHGSASLNVPSLFNYLITFVYFLAYT